MNGRAVFIRLSAFAAACAACASLNAGDTMAFYTFTEGTPGTSAVGTSILNAVDAATHVGTPAVNDNGTHLGKVEFSADAPAKYIFSGKGGVPVATNAQSLFFDGVLDRTNNAKEGGTVSFADIGTELSKCDEYTVEFFWKVDSNEVAGVHAYYSSLIYKPSVVWHDGTHVSTGEPIGDKAVFLPVSPQSYAVSSKAADINYQNEAVLYNNTYAGYYTPSLLDGKWHHIAVTYSRDQKLRRVIADYTSQCCNKSRNGLNRGETVTNSVVESSQSLDLGNYIMRGHFACLRVTKRVLAISELLYASNNENFFTDGGETVFHWRCDGESGAAVSVITNRFVPENFHAVNPNLFYFNDSWIVSGLYTGNGSVVSTFDGVWPTYTNELPHAKKTNVVDGDDKSKVIASNEGSVSLSPPRCSVMNDKLGLTLAKDDFRHVAEGESFTCECFCKFGFQAAVDAGANKSYPWFTIIGSPHNGWAKDWRFGFDLSPRTSGTEGTLDQWEYLRPQLDMYVRKPDSTIVNVTAVGTNLKRGNPPFDEEWHHFAVVYDAPNTNIACYLDYKPWYSKILPGQLLVRDPANQYYIFGYGCSGFPAPVTYDEIRLTRKALSPSQFLHLAKPQRGMHILFR